MIGAEGKLFKPLAYTKTFCLLAALIIAIAIVPCLMRLIMQRRRKPPIAKVIHGLLVGGLGVWLMVSLSPWLGALVVAIALFRFVESGAGGWWRKGTQYLPEYRGGYHCHLCSD